MPVVNTILWTSKFVESRSYVKYAYHRTKWNKTKGHKESLKGVRDVCWPRSWWWYHKCLPMSELNKLYVLNLYSSLYINYTSVRLLKKGKTLTILKIVFIVLLLQDSLFWAPCLGQTPPFRVLYHSGSCFFFFFKSICHIYSFIILCLIL